MSERPKRFIHSVMARDSSLYGHILESQVPRNVNSHASCILQIPDPTSESTRVPLHNWITSLDTLSPFEILQVALN
ncbi:hypothetical protein J6590_012035 [Homalodisca vitripennis]|nr:hypothetical protein J6590_012035 [Homalodisca vitripennis]